MKDILVKSIQEIEKEYFNHVSAVVKDHDLQLKQDLSASESTFAAELRGNLKSNLKLSNLEFRIDLEHSKELVYSERNTPRVIRDSYDKIFQRITAENFENEFKLKRIPDLIIHKSIHSTLKEDQLFVAEIKTDPNITEDDFYADFFKVNLFMSELNFQYGAFIAANIDCSKIIQWLCNYLSDNLFINQSNQKIYLICINKEVSRISLCDFSQVRIDPAIQSQIIQNNFEYINF